MSSVWSFLVKFSSLIVCVLHCFDRVIFKGHLAMASPAELERFVDYVLRVRRCHFIKVLAPQFSDALVEHAQRWARKHKRTYLYRTGSFKKDQWAELLLRKQRIERGLVGILCTQETCNSFALVPGQKRPRFISKPRQQRVLYYYFLDPQLGLIHVRLQTWAPFTLQVYINGHDWLAQQMVRLGMGFVLKHNAFTQLDDPAKTQRQADRFAKLDWTKILTRYGRLVNPLLRKELACYRVHRMTRNWLKMYDKFGLILRVETVINRPKEFSVFRTRKHRDGTTSPGYFPMNKDVGSLVHYQEQALACSRRYLDALAIVDDPAPAYQQLRQLTEPKRVAERSSAGFNPARREDVRLFAAVLDGDHIARGFRNKHIRAALFGSSTPASRQQSAAVGRLVKRLHNRQLVAKIPRTRRWRVTEAGRHLLSLAVKHYGQTWPELAAA